MGLLGKLKKLVKNSIKLANPVKAVKLSFEDPIAAATVGMYSPIIDAKKEQDAVARRMEQSVAEEDRKTEEIRRQNEARKDEQQGDSRANSTAVLLSNQSLLNTSPTLLATAAQDSDEEVRRRLGKGNRLNGG